MGKANRKLNKKKMKKDQVVIMEETKELRVRMQHQFEEEEYSEALSTLAELIQAGNVDAGLMYEGAYCYFMCGDYDRAAEWVNNTLTYEPGHVAARILLARICILQDRTDDGLAIFDFVLEHDRQQLTVDQREELEEVLEYYGRNEQEHLRADFPYVAGFLGIAETVAPIEPTAPIESTPVVEVQVGKTTSADPQQVLSQDISVVDKVRLLNVFAGGYFCSNDFQDAAIFLEEAIKLDARNDETLSNLAVLAHAMEKKEEALAYASRMSWTDFRLLDMLRK